MSADREPPVVHRHAVRIACLDSGGRLLMMNWRDPDSGELLWEPPGGGVEPGESDIEAARREWFEETGLPDVVDGADRPYVVVNRREYWAGRVVVAEEPVFLGHWPGVGPELSRAHLTPNEQVNLVQTRWLARAELAALPERVTPDMVATLRRLDAGGDWI
jgi:8-oxo-dGTP pyrophosphatase MutT (NUDIX family)